MSGSEAPAVGAPDAPAAAGGPDVIVDFLFEAGCLFVTVENLGARPARNVTVAFDHGFTGLGGTVEMHALRLFRGIPFLAPRRRLAAVIDSAAAYFARREPVTIAATVTWQDAKGATFRQTCPHDLGIYADLPMLERM